MSKIYVAVIVLCTAIAACAQTGNLRTVTGVRTVIYNTGQVPVDLSSTTVAAWVPNRKTGAGGYTMLHGSGASDGTFSVPNVPHGLYLLQLGNFYLWTQMSFIDGTAYADRRPNPVFADFFSTTITFNISNLNPWQDTDYFELIVPNTEVSEFFTAFPGVTALTDTFPYFNFLIDGSQGDQVYLEQLVTQNISGLPIPTIGRVLAPPLFNQVDAGDTTISGTLLTVPQNQTFRANINGADLTKETLAANPNAVLTNTSFALEAYPGNLATGLTTAPLDLILFNPQPPTLTGNVDLGDVPYGNPFPSTWPVFLLYSHQATTNYTAPGASFGFPIISLVNGYTTTLPTAKTPLQPLVGVVSSPLINGVDFFANQTGVGLTPTLTWSPPINGTATYYNVQVLRLSNFFGGTRRTIIANLETPATSITLPSGLLANGQAYFFKVTAFYLPGRNVARTPFLGGPTSARADILSGVIQP